jgi:hypothetical protein
VGEDHGPEGATRAFQIPPEKCRGPSIEPSGFGRTRIVARSTVRPLAVLGAGIVCFSALNLEEIYPKGASPRIRPTLITLYRRNSSPVGAAGT